MVIKKEEAYVLKLTEYREILNVLKNGDGKLVSQLMKDLKDIAIRCKKVSKLPGVKTFVDYINSKDNFFLTYLFFTTMKRRSFVQK